MDYTPTTGHISKKRIYHLEGKRRFIHHNWQLFKSLQEGCRLMGIQARIKRRYTTTTNSKHSHRLYPNLIKDRIITGINQVWCSDNTLKQEEVCLWQYETYQDVIERVSFFMCIIVRGYIRHWVVGLKRNSRIYSLRGPLTKARKLRLYWSSLRSYSKTGIVNVA